MRISSPKNINKEHNLKKYCPEICTYFMKKYFIVLLLSLFFCQSCSPIRHPPAWGCGACLILKQMLQHSGTVLIRCILSFDITRLMTPDLPLQLDPLKKKFYWNWEAFCVFCRTDRNKQSKTYTATIRWCSVCMYLHPAETEGEILSCHSFIHWIIPVVNKLSFMSLGPEALCWHTVLSRWIKVTEVRLTDSRLLNQLMAELGQKPRHCDSKVRADLEVTLPTPSSPPLWTVLHTSPCLPCVGAELPIWLDWVPWSFRWVLITCIFLEHLLGMCLGVTELQNSVKEL